MPFFTVAKFQKIFQEILDCKRKNWDLTLRVFCLSKSLITLRANTPLIYNFGFGFESQHHTKKTLIHKRRFNNQKSKNFQLLNLKLSPRMIDFFHPWLPRNRIIRIIINTFYHLNLFKLTKFIKISS